MAGKRRPVVASGDVSNAAVEASLIYAAVRLQLNGATVPEIALVLNVAATRIRQALTDPRAAIAAQHYQMDQSSGAQAAQDAVRATYRLSRAWEVLDDSMASSDPWLRQQAANAVIAAANKGKEQVQRTEVVIAPELAFDDQEMTEQQAVGANCSVLQLTAPNRTD